MSEYQAFVVELNDNIAHVQINRPEKINAMNAAFWTEIIDIFQWIEDTDAVRAVVLSGALPLLLAATYAGLIATHYLGPHGGEGGFGSLDDVAALFRDRWALLAGWVHYLCFDMWTGAWELRDAQRRGMPHGLLVPCLLLTFMFGPVGLLLYFGVRRWYPQPAGAAI